LEIFSTDKRKKKKRRLFKTSVLPQLLQQLAVALPLLLCDRIRVEDDEADEDEPDGRGRHQHLQGDRHFLRLSAASTDVAREAERRRNTGLKTRHARQSFKDGGLFYLG